MAKTLNIPEELIDDLIAHSVADYHQWTNNSKIGIGDRTYSVSYDIGSSYIRLWHSSYGSRSCHGFIVNKAGKFPVGTLLKSATWKAPATNFARGNIFDKDFSRVKWTGIF